MMESEIQRSCSQCEHCKRNDDGHNKTDSITRWCTRNPPVAVNMGKDDYGWSFPQVKYDWICSEFIFQD